MSAEERYGHNGRPVVNGRVVFCERFEPTPEETENADTARLIVAIQSGESDAFGALYSRYFDRIYGYVRVMVGNQHEAEDLAQEVFIRALQALPGFELRRPFLGWLFRVARNAAIDTLRRQRRVDLTEPADIDNRRDEEVAEQAESALTWISDGDLTMFIGRLPAMQRQVLALRYLLDLSTEEIADLIDRTPKAVRQLQSRALRTLEARLVSVGHRDTRVHRARTLPRLMPLPVMVQRRFALGSG
ncbi:MAG: polymerase sigma-70 factor, subfamily, partial [Solirubrobacterales bacterium]|nr:polymerase sigma-70 factor, subfamily [Solirubrobacterales bacterium]